MAATVWKGFISFGLVTFPVRLFSAGRADHVRFHMLHRKDLSRVKEVWYCAEEDKPIERADIVKGYETGKGEYVVVEEEELKKIQPPSATTMDITTFVKAKDVDPIYFESSYYVGPEDAGTKPYHLFAQALNETGHYAIGQVTMHGREHAVVIRPTEDGLVLHTLFYQNELHEGSRTTSKASGKTTAKELDLAKNLVEHMSGPFQPSDFHDTYRDNVEALIDQKQKGKKITAVPKAKKAPVIDLMEALKRSLGTTSARKSPAKKTSSRAKRVKKAA